MYGEAEVTVSTVRATVEPDTDGSASDGAFFAVYSNSVELTFFEIKYLPSYPLAVIPSIVIAVSTVSYTHLTLPTIYSE